jgi:hypothetical protein
MASKHHMITQEVRAKLRIATWLVVAYGAIGLVATFSGNAQSGKASIALLWVPIAIGLLRESQMARFAARVLLAFSILVILVPLLTLVIDPLSEITIALPLLGEFKSNYGIAALVIMPYLLLTIWQWRVFSLPEVAAHFEATARARRARNCLGADFAP